MSKKKTGQVPAKQMDAVFQATFGIELTKFGFECIDQRKWVRSQKTEIREIFLIQAAKGASYLPVWGFSLDYVPHHSGKSVLWHRTPKSAILDLRDTDNDLTVPSLYGNTEAERIAKEVTQKTVPQALKFFEVVSDIEDLPEIFEAQMKKDTSGLGFYNYIQQPLAYAFTLAKLGRDQEAQDQLRKYVQEYNMLPDVAQCFQELLTATSL